MEICSNIAALILMVLPSLVDLCIGLSCPVMSATTGKVCEETCKVPQTPWGCRK